MIPYVYFLAGADVLEKAAVYYCSCSAIPVIWDGVLCTAVSTRYDGRGVEESKTSGVPVLISGRFEMAANGNFVVEVSGTAGLGRKSGDGGDEIFRIGYKREVEGIEVLALPVPDNRVRDRVVAEIALPNMAVRFCWACDRLRC